MSSLLPHLRRFVAKKAWRLFSGVSGPYLTRYKVADLGPIAVRVHQFHRGDEDPDPHNHPWKGALSLILVGGYREFREGKAARDLRPGSWNLITASTFHRVELLDGEAWTLLIHWKGEEPWFFRLPYGELVFWEDYITRKGLQI